MGEGRESAALTRLDECKNSGKWLILKNLQLVTYWLAQLAQNIKNSSATNTFRYGCNPC